MASPYNPPVRGEDFVCYINLQDLSGPGSFRVNPTIAAGDFKVVKDGGAATELTTIPAVTPAGGVWVKITLSTTEMDASNVSVQGIDQTNPKEWADFGLNIVTT
jgi:hypothetical protein